MIVIWPYCQKHLAEGHISYTIVQCHEQDSAMNDIGQLIATEQIFSW